MFVAKRMLCRVFISWGFILCSTYIIGEGRPMKRPDFVSDWLYLSVQTGKDLLKVPHGLGQVPVLVQVQATPPDGPNKDFVFNGMGEVPRDDSIYDKYGAVSYLYDEEFVVVTTMSSDDHEPGKAILTMNNSEYIGPNSQASDDCYVRIFAWHSTSLPEPDFHVGNISLQSGCQHGEDCLVEVNHDFGTYPSLVVVRTRLDDFSLTNHSLMSDAVGSGFIFANTDEVGLHHGFVVYGFNESAFRIWTESQRYTQHYIFCGKDGTGFGICVSNGTLEILAWKEFTLSPTEKMEMLLGAQANETFDQEKLMSAKTSGREYFVQLWAVARSGPNNNFRFLASGSMSGYRLGKVTPCTYGGLVFAYSNTTLRLWKPNSFAKRAAIICISDVFAGGKYSQSTNDAFAVAHVWITLDHTLHEECTTSRDCWDAFSTCRDLTCQCEAGFTETHQDTNHTTTGCYVDGECNHANETAGDCIRCHLPFDACHWPGGPAPNTHTTTIVISALVRLYIIIGGSAAGLLTLVTIVTILCLRQRKRKAARLNRYELMQTL